MTKRTLKSSRRSRHLLTYFAPLAAVLLTLSSAGAHDIRGDADPANDWIEGLANRENARCCGANDCYPLQAGALRASPDGNLAVEIGGEWFDVPMQHLVRDSSPDGRAWACPERKSTSGGFMYTVQGIRCLLLPMMM